jgi:hypothetical protein
MKEFKESKKKLVNDNKDDNNNEKSFGKVNGKHENSSIKFSETIKLINDNKNDDNNENRFGKVNDKHEKSSIKSSETIKFIEVEDSNYKIIEVYTFKKKYKSSPKHYKYKNSKIKDYKANNRENADNE